VNCLNERAFGAACWAVTARAVKWARSLERPNFPGYIFLSGGGPEVAGSRVWLILSWSPGLLSTLCPKLVAWSGLAMTRFDPDDIRIPDGWIRGIPIPFRLPGNGFR